MTTIVFVDNPKERGVVTVKTPLEKDGTIHRQTLDHALERMGEYMTGLLDPRTDTDPLGWKADGQPIHMGVEEEDRAFVLFAYQASPEDDGGVDEEVPRLEPGAYWFDKSGHGAPEPVMVDGGNPQKVWFTGNPEPARAADEHEHLIRIEEDKPTPDDPPELLVGETVILTKPMKAKDLTEEIGSDGLAHVHLPTGGRTVCPPDTTILPEGKELQVISQTEKIIFVVVPSTKVRYCLPRHLLRKPKTCDGCNGRGHV